MAGERGFEPLLDGPELYILPFEDSPTMDTNMLLKKSEKLKFQSFTFMYTCIFKRLNYIFGYFNSKQEHKKIPVKKTPVQSGNMENAECILCGRCVDNCPKQVIKYTFSKPIKPVSPIL